jgi:vitamin B12 transporter
MGPETRAMTRPAVAALLCGATFLTAGHAWAQTLPPTPVEPLTVQAVRLTAPLSLTPDAYVVTGDQIDRRQSAFAADSLAAVPGVSISENGPFGGVSSVSLRGVSSDKTLVLIDGVPVNDPSAPAGGFDVSSLDASDISRMEVLTGPQSSLWGSDAIGGVVSIVTREPSGVSAFAEGGSLATIREGASVGEATDRYAIGLSASGFRTAGISKADEKFFDNPPPNGFNNTTIALNARAALTDRVTLDARVRANYAATEYDAGTLGPAFVSPSADNSDARTVSGYVRAKIADVHGFDQELRIDILDLDREYHGQYPFSALGGQQTLRWSAQRQQTAWGLDVGADYRSAWENTSDGRAVEGAAGAYAIGRWSPVAALNLTASLREDVPERYAAQTTGRLAAGWAVGAGFTLKASAGQGFKAPSIFETTYPCFECTVPGPNRGLRPERAEGFDGGLAWRSPGGAVEWEATAFQLNVRDQIDYQVPIGYLNIDHVRSTGVEMSASLRLPAGLTAHGSYTFDDALDVTADTPRLKIPRDSGAASLGWRGGGATIDLGVRAQDGAPDVYGPIKPFAVAYLAGSYALSPNLSFTARVENLAGSHYEEAYGYGEPGRTVLVGLRWRP